MQRNAFANWKAAKPMPKEPQNFTAPAHTPGETVRGRSTTRTHTNMTTPNTDTPGTAGNSPPPTGYQKSMEAHDSRIYFEQHTPQRIPPGNRITRYIVVTVPLPHDYNAVEIHTWMQEPHAHLVYALPQRRAVRKWVDEMKRRYCPRVAP